MNHLRDPRPGDTYERDVTALLHRGYLVDARRFWTLVTRGG